MTTGDWAFILLLLVILLCTLVCALAWKMAYADGHEAGRLYERNRQNMRRIRANRAGPRQTATMLVGRAPWEAPARTVRTESMLMLPAPVTAPIAHAGAGRYPHLLTADGEFHAVAKVTTDRYIEEMRRTEEIYRRELTS